MGRIVLATLAMTVASTAVAGDADTTRALRLAQHFPVTLEYNKDLGAGEKRQSVASTVAILRDLGITLVLDEAEIAPLVAASGGRLAARPVDDPDLLYDAVYYLTDLARLPSALYPLFRRIAVVEGLREEDPVSGRKREVPLAYEPTTETILANHENLNLLELFGRFMHPKVNFAMLLELGLEQHLKRLGPVALRELGLDIVVDDDEWARLNGPDGRGVYNGEKLAFMGLKTAARVTPPGILIDLFREIRTGVPSTAFAGLPDATQPWWSPRFSPALDRQGTLRSLYGRNPEFYERLGGSNGLREDSVLKEKTRLVLYAAFVASGGVLDHAYWVRRHPAIPIVSDLTRDFDAAFLDRLQERLARNPETRSIVLK